MTYQIRIEKRAEKFITQLPQPEKERVLKAISKLPEGDVKRLKGKRSAGMYRLRVGNYRIIYTMDGEKLIICVVDAGNRGQIYDRYK